MSMARLTKLWDHQVGIDVMPNDVRDADTFLQQNWGSLFNGGMKGVRKPIDMTETLQQFDRLFASGSIFRCATELCTLHLVRSGEKLSQYEDTGKGFWSDYLTTGDNTRERPYADLYAKLTTKSNTYRVHFRVQSLQSGLSPLTPTGDPRWKQWNEKQGKVLSEYRGSSLIERYIDPLDPSLSSYSESWTDAPQINPDGTVAHSGSLDPYYRFRVLSVKKFGQ